MEEARTYTFSEACDMIGTSKTTYRRYLTLGHFEDVERDGNNWRIFDDEDIERIVKILKAKKLLRQKVK